jgi:hypothetical protein
VYDNEIRMGLVNERTKSNTILPQLTGATP